MIWRRIMLAIVGLIILLIGMVWGASIASSHREPELWEISPEFRQGYKLEEMFADYKAGRVVYTVTLPLCGTRIKARVVNTMYRGADFGFVPVAELGETPTHFWYYKSGEFELKEFNEGHFLVHIKDRYVSYLIGHSDESKYSPVEKEGRK